MELLLGEMDWPFPNIAGMMMKYLDGLRVLSCPSGPYGFSPLSRVAFSVEHKIGPTYQPLIVGNETRIPSRIDDGRIFDIPECLVRYPRPWNGFATLQLEVTEIKRLVICHCGELVRADAG